MKELLFDETTHKYKYEGKVIPSVTQVIREVLKGDSDFTGNQYAMDFGKCLHTTLELHDKGILKNYEYDSRMDGYIQQWDKCKKENDLSIKEIELQVFSEQLLLAGRIDRVLYQGGQVVIADLKSGNPYKEYPLQLQFYKMLYGDKVAKRMCIYLKSDSYSIEEHSKESDEATCLSILQVWNYRKNRL